MAGGNGIGAYIRANVNGALVVDGQTISATGTRVLVAGNTNSYAYTNGIYSLTTPGNTTTRYTLTRSSDYDDSTTGEVIAGDYTLAVAGTTNAGKTFMMIAAGSLADGGIKIGTDPIVWTQVSGQGAQGYQGVTGATGAGGALGYYGNFYDTSNQSATSSTAAYAVAIGTDAEPGHGVTLSNTSRINFTYAGTYAVTPSIQFQNTSNKDVYNVNVWLKKQGSDIPNSNSQVTIPAGHGAVNGGAIFTTTFIVTVTAGQYIEFYWQTENTNVSIFTLAAGTTPTTPITPGVIVSVQQVMYTQVGPTGPQGATGTSAYSFSTPLAVSTGSTVSIAAATTGASGVITLGGDLNSTGSTAGTPYVGSWQGQPFTTGTTAGQVYVFSGTTWQASALSGDATLASGGALTLKSTGTSGTYGASGSTNSYPIITTDAQGRVTGASTAPVSVIGSTVVAKTANYAPTQADNGKTITFNGSGLACSLPVSGITMPWCITVQNISTSQTLLLNVSSGSLLNGNLSNFYIGPNQSAFVWCGGLALDGTSTEFYANITFQQAVYAALVGTSGATSTTGSITIAGTTNSGWRYIYTGAAGNTVTFPGTNNQAGSTVTIINVSANALNAVGSSATLNIFGTTYAAGTTATGAIPPNAAMRFEQLSGTWYASAMSPTGLSGDVTVASSGIATLATTGPGAGTYGSSGSTISHAIISLDAKGRVTGATSSPASLVAGVLNATGATTWTASASDNGQFVRFSSTVTVTLPSTTPSAPWLATYYGAGSLTITPTSPATLNGSSSSYYLSSGIPALVWTDGTNYFVQPSISSGNWIASSYLNSTQYITAANTLLNLGNKAVYNGTVSTALTLNSASTNNFIPQILVNGSTQTVYLLPNGQVTGSPSVLNAYGTTYAGYVVGVGGISTNGTIWTVTTGTTHNFLTGQTVYLGGLSPSQYNNSYTIASTGATNTFTISNTAQPGAVSFQGTATVQPFPLPAGGAVSYQGINGSTNAIWLTGSSPQTLSGDVTVGNTGAATVKKVQGVTISGTPASGQVLTASATNAASWSNLPNYAQYLTAMLPVIGSVTAVAETVPRAMLTSGLQFTSGTFRVNPVYLTAGTVVSNISFTTTVNTAGATVTGTWGGIFTASGNTLTLVAATAQQGLSSIATSTLFTWPIATIASGSSTSYTVPTSGLYYVGVCITASTMPTLASINGVMLNTLSPPAGFFMTGSTSPASIGSTYAGSQATLTFYYVLT
jgi:hypothetical protein